MGLVDGRYLPEPLDNNVVCAVAALVLGVFSPVVHVHVSQTAHEQLSKRGAESLLTFGYVM